MKVINKGGTDKTVIMAVREGLLQPFEAGDWVDLRVGFLLSICGETDPGEDDTITSLGETITHTTSFPISDYYFIGVKDSSSLFPAQTGSVFIGYTNTFGGGPNGKGDSAVVTSDEAVGTTNADYWRPKNSEGNVYTTQIYDGVLPRASAPNLNQHFVQDFSGGHAAGYATLLMLRLTRATPESLLITTTIKQGTTSADVLFTSTPTKALLQSNMESYPSTVAQLGPVTLSQVPTALFLYWPFHSSRLRIHCMGILKVG